MQKTERLKFFVTRMKDKLAFVDIFLLKTLLLFFLPINPLGNCILNALHSTVSDIIYFFFASVF